jgi:hypothetical protein
MGQNMTLDYQSPGAAVPRLAPRWISRALKLGFVLCLAMACFAGGYMLGRSDGFESGRLTVPVQFDPRTHVP